MSRLHQILLFVRRGNLDRAVQFYSEGIGLDILDVGETLARLHAGVASAPYLALKVVDGNEAVLSTGYGPFLNFTVNDFDLKIPQLIQMGAQLDGTIEYTEGGKIAALRSPDGHMIRLHELTNGSGVY